MTFSVVAPLSGYSGWAFLQRTQDAQLEALSNSSVIQRETEYFRANIANVRTPQDLTEDYTLLKVALGAFGLDDDLPNKAFVEKVLVDGTLTDDALANRLSDKRYFEMAEAFGFDRSTPSTVISDFPNKILDLYTQRQFEIAVGNQQPALRVALSLERDLVAISENSSTEDAKWFSILGTPALREVFQTAFGLPSSFATIDLDQQVGVMKERTERAFGDSSVSQFVDETSRDELIRKYLALDEIKSLTSATTSGQAIALTLMQSSTLRPLVELR